MAPALPLAGLRFSVLGAGKVGASLAAWSVASGARLESLAGRTGLDRLTTENQDLLLIAVPEAGLSAAIAQLALRHQARTVFHTAGALGVEVLAPLAARGSACGVLHPLKAFSRPLPDPAAGQGITFGWSGDPATRGLAEVLVAAWGGVLVAVPDHARTIYHLAATLAAGGVATLLAAASELAARLELPPEVAAGYFTLARGSLEAAAEAEAARPGGSAATLTGPVARGDGEAIERGLAALATVAPEKRALFLALSVEGLAQVARQPSSSGRDEALTRALRQRLAEALGELRDDLLEANQDTDSERVHGQGQDPISGPKRN